MCVYSADGTRHPKVKCDTENRNKYVILQVVTQTRLKIKLDLMRMARMV